MKNLKKFNENVRIKLTDDQINFLSDLPEHGMGYQMVDIVLKDGRVLKNKTVLNSTYLTIGYDDNIEPTDIEEIKIH